MRVLLVQLFTVALLVGLVGPVLAATPISKSYDASSYTETCDDGRKAAKCFESSDISLSWDHADAREDGSPLPQTEISHYVIKMSRDGGPETNIAVGKKTSFRLRFMPAGTYTFSIATVDSDNVMGAFSDTIQTTIN